VTLVIELDALDRLAHAVQRFLAHLQEWIAASRAAAIVVTVDPTVHAMADLASARLRMVALASRLEPLAHRLQILAARYRGGETEIARRASELVHASMPVLAAVFPLVYGQALFAALAAGRSAAGVAALQVLMPGPRPLRALSAAGASLGVLVPGAQRVVASAASDCQASRGYAQLLERIPHGPAQVRIDRLSSAQGDRYVVYVSGTRDFDLHPTSEPWDMTSNFQALSGSAQADSEHAVRTAMEQAGIDARTPVILVGHSQGGLIASRIAASGDFAVTDLVVAGSPSHGVSVPERIRVTAFEHSDDLVPALSGPLTAATASTLFLRQKAPAGAQGVLPEHELQSYIATARLADASGDPLVAARRKALTVGAGAKGAVNQGSGEPRETCTSRDYEATRILPTSSWRG
jgi:hypothetical protein